MTALGLATELAGRNSRDVRYAAEAEATARVYLGTLCGGSRVVGYGRLTHRERHRKSQVMQGKQEVLPSPSRQWFVSTSLKHSLGHRGTLAILRTTMPSLVSRDG
jgi:hypothetical protein